MSSSSPPPQTWEDRRALFQRGRDVHEPARRLSQSSGTVGGVIDSVRRASNASIGSAILGEKKADNTTETQRRRSSHGALFGNLQQHKRGSEDYNTRKASFTDQIASGGMMSGWFNSTFKGGKSEK